MKAVFYLVTTEDESSPEGQSQAIRRTLRDARKAFRESAVHNAAHPQDIRRITVTGNSVVEIAMAAAHAVTICNSDCGGAARYQIDTIPSPPLMTPQECESDEPNYND